MRHAERCIVSDIPCWSRAKGGETKFWLLRSLQSIEPRCAAQMLRDHLIQSTIISALDKVIQKHPANPKPFKKDKPPPPAQEGRGERCRAGRGCGRRAGEPGAYLRHASHI